MGHLVYTLTGLKHETVIGPKQYDSKTLDIMFHDVIGQVFEGAELIVIRPEIVNDKK